MINPSCCCVPPERLRISPRVHIRYCVDPELDVLYHPHSNFPFDHLIRDFHHKALSDTTNTQANALLSLSVCFSSFVVRRVGSIQVQLPVENRRHDFSRVLHGDGPVDLHCRRRGGSIIRRGKSAGA